MKKIILIVAAVSFMLAVTCSCGTGHVSCDAYGATDAGKEIKDIDNT